MTDKDPLDFFELKPIRAAKVSEISESTATSQVAPEERVNFHIGNPVQDERLYSAYFRLALGIDVSNEKVGINDIDKAVDELGLSAEDKTRISLIAELVKKSAPYSPRGGFLKSKPHPVVQRFDDWLSRNQQDPLSYDIGDKSGKREIILASGGIFEALRVLFHSLSEFMATRPVRIYVHGFEIPTFMRHFPDLSIVEMDNDETTMVHRLTEQLDLHQSFPGFLLMGKLLSEDTRRQLRHISLECPLMFIEANDAPNNLSLAREAKMMNRVIRLITPGVFESRLKNLSVIFMAGNSDFLRVFETVHFQLKGTPSSTEIELLDYLLRNTHSDVAQQSTLSVEAEYEGMAGIAAYKSVNRIVSHAEDRLETIVSDGSKMVEALVTNIQGRVTSNLTDRLHHVERIHVDKFQLADAGELIDELDKNIHDKDWTTELASSYLDAFINHHPEYKPQNALVASGSSRTVLSLLGFHCGIGEVIIPDLSWTYEHCFPRSFSVALTDDFQLDVEAIINTIETRILNDSNWSNYGAVVINNPHNATGQVFHEEDVTRLTRWLLERKIFIIDDLSYQNVKPSDELEPVPTIRQIADELVHSGYITEEESAHVVTVHSMSKTDSFAGARLSVVEIREENLFRKFQSILSFLEPNLGAITLAYLFYRSRVESVNAYHRLRNRIFKSRSQALLDAVELLPKDRNPFDIRIDPPIGSMYPRMVVNNLPAGLSLDWLASGLARQGVGLVPLSTFAHTERGFDTGRKSFRLTLGGTDDAETLFKKTRRVLIDLNRMIAEEAANYNRREFKYREVNIRRQLNLVDKTERWRQFESSVCLNAGSSLKTFLRSFNLEGEYELHRKRIEEDFLPARLSIFRTRFEERQRILNETANLYLLAGLSIKEIVEKEFYKDDLSRRKEVFGNRLFDRTVHPTQMYSIQTELRFEKLINSILHGKEADERFCEKLKTELLREYFGLNVPIVSAQEPEELLLDLNTMIAVENYLELHSDDHYETFLSFWGDWDGSSRPSGQGHSLVGAVVIENVSQQAEIIRLLLRSEPGIITDQHLLTEIEKLPESNKKFSSLLSRITQLTHHLERRYRGTLPVNIRAGAFRKVGMKLHLAKDPLTSVWQHNDRLEREMLDLRRRRRDTLEYYFSLNKQLRKTIHSLIPRLIENFSNRDLLLAVSEYRDLLKRFAITPRIHQKLITAQDQFAIDTTVHNINEINEISGKYGNPGLVLALQVSMTTKPEALISLDRKLRTDREQTLRQRGDREIPGVLIVPLFEEVESVKGIKNYLNKVWEYSFQSRRMDQETGDRFTEIIGEIFVAGSDLSQQIGQAMGMSLYLESKFDLLSWLSSHGLSGKVRMKLGSGEPMQRQGGYYSPMSGERLFHDDGDSRRRFSAYLQESTRRSTYYATTPLMGVHSSGDLRTFQSNLFEKCRHLSVEEFSRLIYHIKKSQEFYESDAYRASEPLSETRLQFKNRGIQELERITVGRRDGIFNKFLEIHTDNFRQILYGKEEDIVGIHIISYFIGKTTPPLRDRPTARPGQDIDKGSGQEIIQRIAGTIPLSKYGSLLRAISHNQAQTVVLGVNQLTTGIFRALDVFSQMEFAEGEPLTLISDQVLPRLPVYEMINTLRIYHDANLVYVDKLKKAFPPGNSALTALREDIDLIEKFLPLFQKELLRRHGLDVSEFFSGDVFVPELLPTLRPDVAVLLQENIFNTEMKILQSLIGTNIDKGWHDEVARLLNIPKEVGKWRETIWKLLEEPIFQRVMSFSELALALHALSSSEFQEDYVFTPKKMKIAPALTPGTFDDSMQEFLSAALDYLTAISKSMVEVPVSIIRALREVEKIMKIEEQALDPKEQDLLRFYLLQIARLTSENG